ncbi:hypothetical protein Kpho02_77480 [Kitasatospora phosalacinea]|uniref:Uncharacterized protein n=1 Tax=Kitasatospora phosalacinea TaxID=2065 RepID=A0A9W6V572_9ACTN|nr:hypothetical protein [Kitasatospora phosalacinea]GLW75451.1 hypothetical protein Kpho02_77480 [Kitasatospora phosalacinea]
MTVSWNAEWYCGECGSSGQEHFEDDTEVEADHDCDEGGGSGSIGWDGRAECGECGWVLESDFEDYCWVASDHVCGDESAAPAEEEVR